MQAGTEINYPANRVSILKINRVNWLVGESFWLIVDWTIRDMDRKYDLAPAAYGPAITLMAKT